MQRSGRRPRVRPAPTRVRRAASPGGRRARAPTRGGPPASPGPPTPPRPERVRSTHDTVLDAIELTVANAAQWQAAADAADRDAVALGGKPVALSYKATDKVRTIDFLGYAYTRTPSDVSGALMTHYDE